MFHWKKYFSISSTKFFFFDKVVSSKLRLGEDDRLWVTSFRKLLMTTNDTEHFPWLRNVGWISNYTFRCGCFVQLMRINLKTSPKSLIPPKYRLNSGLSATTVWQTIMSSHYSDVLMGKKASQITSLTQPFIQTHIKENIKAPRHWPLCGEFTGDRWIPAQMTSNAENVSIWWRHHDDTSRCISFRGSTHWGRDKMAAIFQTASFFEKEIVVLRFKCCWNVFVRVLLTMSHRWFR